MPDNTIDKKSFPAEFIDLLKQGGQDDKLKSMIEDQALHNFVDADGTRALHLAAAFNNVKIMYFLIELGCETEAEDSSGKTPLMTALLRGKFYPARRLFHHRVGRLTAPEPWKSARHAKAMLRVATDLSSKLRHEKFNSEQIGEFLARLECCLCTVMNLRDPVLTRSFLRSEVQTHRNVYHKGILFEDIVPALDVRTILHDGRWPKEWTSLLCRYVVNHILNYQKTRAGRGFLRRLFSWQVFKEDNIECLEEALRQTERKNVKIFLQYDFHTSIKAKFGRDVMVCLFGNCSPRIIPYMLRRGVIRLDARGRENDTPLHYAARQLEPELIKFLLRKGADPNALNDLGETPVTLVLADDFDEAECLKPLLLAGADHPRTCKEFNDSLDFGEMSDHYDTDCNRLLAGQLAVYEALGLPTEKLVRDLFDNEECAELQAFYEDCRRQLDLLKTKEIKSSFSLFSVLVEKPMRIARHFGDEDLRKIEAFVKSTRKTVYSYYRETLKRRARDIAKINRYRSRAVEVICECIGIGDPTHLVVCKIADYFGYRDLMNFELYKF